MEERTERIVALAIEWFEGRVDAARDWLTTPAVAPGGRAPLEVASTDVAAIEVESLSVGYRVRSLWGTQVRIWATQRLTYWP